MNNTPVSGTFETDDEVLVELERKKRNRVIFISIFSCLILAAVAVFIIFGSKEYYNSVEDLAANYPNGVSADETFIVKGKTYRYSTSNKAFVEMKELSDDDKATIDAFDVSVDMSGLDELKAQIRASGDYNERQSLEGDYVSLLKVLKNKAVENQSVVLDYQTNYVYNSTIEKKLSEKFAECESVLNQLDGYGTELLGYMNEDKLLFKNEYSSLVQLSGTADDIQSQLDGLNDKYRTATDNLSTLMSTLSNDEGYADLIKEQGLNLEKLKNDINKLNERIEQATNVEELRNLLSQVEKYTETLKELQGVLDNSQYAETLKDIINNMYQSSIDAIDTKITTITNHINDVDNQFTELQNSTTNTLNQLIDERNDLKGKLAELEQKLADLQNSTNDGQDGNDGSDGENGVSGADGKDYGAEIDGVLAQIEQLKQELTENTDNITSIMNEYNTTVDARITQINDVDLTEIYKQIKEIQGLIDGLDKDIVSSDDDLRKLLEQERNALLEKLGVSYDELKEAINALDESTQERLGIQKEELIFQIDEEASQLKDSISETDTRLSEALGTETANRISELTETKEVLENALSETDERINNKLDDNMSELNQNLDDTRADLVTQLNGVNDALSLTIDELVANFTQRFEADEADITTNANNIAQLRIDLTQTQQDLVNARLELTNAISELRTYVDTADTAINERITGVQDDLTDNVNNLQAQITSNDNDIADIYAKYNALKDSYEAYVIANDAAIQALRSEFEQYVTDNDNRVNNFKDDYNTYIAGNNQRIENLENRFNTYVTNNDQRVLAVENRVTNVENNLTAYIASNNTALTTLQNSFNDFVANKYNVYVANNDVNIANLTNKINTANTNISNLTTNLNTTNTNVTNLTNTVNTINNAITNINTDLTGYLKKTVADDTYATKGEVEALRARIEALEAGGGSSVGSRTLISTMTAKVSTIHWRANISVTAGSQSNPSGSSTLSCGFVTTAGNSLPTISASEEYVLCIDTQTAGVYATRCSTSDSLTLVAPALNTDVRTGSADLKNGADNWVYTNYSMSSYSSGKKTDGSHYYVRFTTTTSGTADGTKVWLKSGDWIQLSDGYRIKFIMSSPGTDLTCAFLDSSGNEMYIYTGGTSVVSGASSGTTNSSVWYTDLNLESVYVYSQPKS